MIENLIRFAWGVEILKLRAAEFQVMKLMKKVS